MLKNIDDKTEYAMRDGDLGHCLERELEKRKGKARCMSQAQVSVTGQTSSPTGEGGEASEKSHKAQSVVLRAWKKEK